MTALSATQSVHEQELSSTKKELSSTNKELSSTKKELNALQHARGHGVLLYYYENLAIVVSASANIKSQLSTRHDACSIRDVNNHPFGVCLQLWRGVG